jgi:hypothetical protein
MRICFDKNWERLLGQNLPSFANLFMGYFEERFLDSCELKPWVWWRFLDDVFMIWLHGEEELNNFLSKLNSFQRILSLLGKLVDRKLLFLMCGLIKLMVRSILMCILSLLMHISI